MQTGQFPGISPELVTEGTLTWTCLEIFCSSFCILNHNSERGMLRPFSYSFGSFPKNASSPDSSSKGTPVFHSDNVPPLDEVCTVIDVRKPF